MIYKITLNFEGTLYENSNTFSIQALQGASVIATVAGLTKTQFPYIWNNIPSGTDSIRVVSGDNLYCENFSRAFTLTDGDPPYIPPTPTVTPTNTPTPSITPTNTPTPTVTPSSTPTCLQISSQLAVSDTDFGDACDRYTTPANRGTFYGDNTDFSSATELYTNSNCSAFAVEGWYSDGETARFWDGTQFTTTVDCGSYGSTPTTTLTVTDEYDTASDACAALNVIEGNITYSGGLSDLSTGDTVTFGDGLSGVTGNSGFFKILGPSNHPNLGQVIGVNDDNDVCLLYTSPSPRDRQKSRMPSSA